MAKNRVIYFLLLAAGAVLFVVHGAWFYWIVLLAVLALPFVSLLCSLPMILTAQPELTVPPEVTRGTQVVLRLSAQVPKWMPSPTLRYRAQITEEMTDTVRTLQFSSGAPQVQSVFTPPHCGAYRISVTKCRAYDALGLWSFRRTAEERTVLVLPSPEQPEDTAYMDTLQPVVFQPKPGGGFSDYHDHREYRPGDSVKEIRWKLSCKTDKLIVREPLLPAQKLAVAVLPAPDAQTLDRALARLCWVSDYLAHNELSHRVFWRDGASVFCEEVKTDTDVQRMLRRAVCSVPTEDTGLPLEGCSGARIIYVSGAESEAAG